jgi:hypothetical protein
LGLLALGITERKAKEMGAARMRSTRFFFADRIFRGGKPCGFLLFIAFRSIAVLSLSTYIYTPSGREATISALNQASPFLFFVHTVIAKISRIGSIM